MKTEWRIVEGKNVEGKIAEPAPEITPDMIHSTFEALDAQGLIHHMKGGDYLPTEGGWKLLREVVSGKEEIVARGHKNITAVDGGCFEIITGDGPIMEGNVIAVNADKACRSLSSEFKRAARTANKMSITIEAGGVAERVSAYGSPALKLTDANEIAVRKSDFIDGKTVAILADKAANDFSKAVKLALKNPKTEVKITLEVL